MSNSKKIQKLPSDYAAFLKTIKQHISESRIQAYRAVNKELIGLYWNIGREIALRQKRDGWGKSIVEKLSYDLREELPGTSGFSTQNLWYMRQFYLEYNEHPNLQQVVGEIPWGQNLIIIAKVKELSAREYYLKMTVEMGWSRNVLLHQIQTQAHKRHKLATKQHNFPDTLPAALAEQADQAMKDVYALDFLGITKPVVERELERRLVNQIRSVLLEFGHGFAFIGNQYPVKLGNEEYFIDLLFYHRKLKCLVAIELKAGKFKPEYAGKMNFYLNLLNDFVREPDENLSIGIILCGDRNRMEVEYSLKGIEKPMGVAEYTLTRKLPSDLVDKLPKPEELERQIMQELGKEEMEGEAERVDKEVSRRRRKIQ
jgi:predicted nuclease of restriction endonuclease-like (RecB) superfamily